MSAVTIQRSGSVAELTLCRPEAMNAFDGAMHTAFVDALDQLRDDRGTRAVVLAAQGRFFSAGGDFELMRALHDDAGERARVADEARHLLRALLGLRPPVVVALQGPAIGLGATIVLACDAIVAARSAALTDPHVNIGLVAGDGGCVVWPAAAGMALAKRHLLTGDPLPAERAYQLGLVSDLVDEPADALPAARALAERMAALPPLAVQGTKASLNRMLSARADEVLDFSLEQEVVTMTSADLLEAVAAFTERRPGRYQGT
jgi:enoyl-CoA hydratase